MRTRRDAATLIFQRRVKIIDRCARALISCSGIGIICAVLGIGLFLFFEIVPLFQGAKVRPGLSVPALPHDERPLLVIIDEHQEQALVLGASPVLRLITLGQSAPARLLPIEALQGQRITAVSRVLGQPDVALGTDQGNVWLGTIALHTVFEGTQRTVQPDVHTDAVLQAVPGHRITQLAFHDDGQQGLVVSGVDDAHVICTRITTRRPLIGSVRRAQFSVPLPLSGSGQPTALLAHESARQVVIGTTHGVLLRWGIGADGSANLIEQPVVVPQAGVTALAYVLGDRSIVVGGENGNVATWSLVRSDASPDGWRLTKIHAFPPHPAGVTAIAASPRDKGFVTTSSDGTARLHFMTSERTLAEWSLRGAVPMVGDFSPKSNGLLLADQHGVVHHWMIDNPHPEISWRALFGKIWYEGYAAPDYIWQSTGGTDDFESKFSLIPLAFGTLKGTFYALLLAVPLALFGALYCSQFLERRLRSPVKSTVELMAALPSVVLGFVTGVLLAPFVHGHVASVLMLPLVLPCIGIGGVVLSHQVSALSIKTFVQRHEFWVLTAWVAVGVGVAIWLGPWIERWIFGGDFEGWLLKMTGTRYDQRNSLVVGWAMGFAVIPIIFTICEDAFSAVPRHLIGASLACGASAWQTAWRVVLPAAGSGVFSAIMVGFGRAVGETMIVLMATGNTPVLDWSIFNGFRALSANIAVEIPEAPNGGTLYRVLFIAALLLFTITFVVNTAAEIVRLRLRRKLQGI